MSGRPAVVLLHGQPGSASHWRQVIDRLPGDIRVVAEDRPGYGNNPEPATGLLGNAGTVLRRLDQLGIEQAAVAGHSWAGGVALALAQRHPDRVAGVALVSSIGPGAVSALDRALAFPVVGNVASWVFFRLAAPLIRRRFEVGQHPGEWRSFLVEQQAMVDELPGLVHGLRTIAAPTVVVAGDGDRIVPRRVAEALADRIPNAELRLLPGEGHVLPLTAPGEVADAIASVAGATPRAHRPAPASAPPQH